MSSSNLRLTDGDFDAYSPTKATSKAYSRPRMDIKQRALTWARGVVARLAEQGFSVDVQGSDEHPSIRNRYRVDGQWVFFWRDEKAREDLDRLLSRGRTIAAEFDEFGAVRQHVFLALRITAHDIEIGLSVHPEAKVDLENLRARLDEADSTLPADLATALRALPDQFRVGAGSARDERVACSALTEEALVPLLRRATDGQEPLWLGWTVPREAAVEHTDILDGQLEDALTALAPIYRLIAWSRENDHLALDRRIEGVEQERARAHAELEAENERWRAEQTAARERSMEQAKTRLDESLPARRPTLENLFRSIGPRPSASADKPGAPRPQPARRPQDGPQLNRPASRQGASSPQGGKATPPAGPRPERAPLQPDRPKEPQETRPQPQTSAASGGSTGGPLDKGANVRVLRGPFEGKLGVIGELDGRGGARVLLGLLSTRMELADLEPVNETQERPVLGTSHRHPPLPASRKPR
ncbi:KOW motif-containing protein [Chondromyces crocatus]|uniref:KOW domain-containing protein n=1 Tax=Chondromyces crocatus TaxID=52 RepID=A0A0K1E4W3_CHOCO|nr:KOW motif-containing protein [Chondromyces crocatus]AKT35920.1 uncharacterized protein CMC5_000310 [Chondromyces crocatus]